MIQLNDHILSPYQYEFIRRRHPAPLPLRQHTPPLDIPMASLNKTVLAFITVGITGSCIIAPVDAHAQSIGDFLGSVGLGLGAGGNCDTGESSETGESRNWDGSTKTPSETTIGKTDCSGSRDLIKHITNRALKNEQRLIQSQHTLGMINSIGSIAAPIFGGLISNSQARAQAASQAPDNSQYLQVIQQQQQQIDELRQMMAQSREENTLRVRHSYQPQRWVGSSQRTSLRQVNLF